MITTAVESALMFGRSLTVQDCDTEDVAPIDIAGADHYDGEVSLLRTSDLVKQGLIGGIRIS